jgi:hypothetical protein
MVVDRLRQLKLWGPIHSEKVSSLEELVPSPASLSSASEGEWLGGLHWSGTWHQSQWQPPRLRPTAAAPEHLLDVPSNQMFAQGTWAVDHAIQFDGEGPRYALDNIWQLPRRWRMTGSFGVRYGGPQSTIRMGERSSRNGNLVTFESRASPVSEIQVPSAREAVRYAMSGDGAGSHTSIAGSAALPRPLVAWSKISNEARYLDGVLGLCGGLQEAEQILLHPFLLRMLSTTGASPTAEPMQAVPSINRLAKRIKIDPTFDLRLERDREFLASLAIKAARDLKSRKTHLRLEWISDQFREYRKEYWTRNLQPTSDESFDWDTDEQDSLNNCLVSLRQKGILHQGHQWTCRECHHKNWVDMSGLRSELICNVCRSTISAPVDVNWVFRPNAFLVDSLRDHSVLSLIWTTRIIRNRSRRSFVYVGPTWFGFDENSEKLDAEADLLIVQDGQCLICEAKSSWQFPKAEIDQFIKLCTRLRPNRALFSVMESGNGHKEWFADASAELASAGVEFELLTLDTHPLHDDPYLPH